MAFFVFTVREAILLEEPAGAALAFVVELGTLVDVFVGKIDAPSFCG
jgi:hypothetical protein